MKPIKTLAPITLALAIAIAACVPSSETQPVSTPTPSPAQTQAPPQVVQQPVFENYLDAPQTPGNWRYSSMSGASVAHFGTDGTTPRFAIRCENSNRDIYLMRPAQRAVQRASRILTETTVRLATAAPSPRDPATSVITLRASDPLLDAMAITKGRFAIETEGMETLYLPAWSEISRVIEDCR